MGKLSKWKVKNNYSCIYFYLNYLMFMGSLTPIGTPAFPRVGFIAILFLL